MNKEYVLINTGNREILWPFCNFNCSVKYGAGLYTHTNNQSNSTTHFTFHSSPQRLLPLEGALKLLKL